MALNFRENKEKIYREQDYNYFISLLPTLEKKYPGYEILATASNDDFYACAAAYYGKKGIFDCASLKTSLPKVKTKSLLLVILYDTDLKEYQNIVANPNAREIQEVDYTNFFLVELFP